MLVIMKSAILIYNTQAGRGKIGRNVDHIVAIFRNAGYDMRPRLIAFGENPFDGYETVDLAVVAGGDGTLNYVVNAMKRKGLSLTLGVIPAGTANDFAGALGMSRNILKAAQQIAEGVVEQIDCGKVEQIGRGRDKHPDKDIYFVNIFSFGLFTTTSQHTSEHLKHRIGRLAYVVAAMRDLRNLHSIPLTITTDNETFYYQTLMGLVFNGETAGRVPRRSFRLSVPSQAQSDSVGIRHGALHSGDQNPRYTVPENKHAGSGNMHRRGYGCRRTARRGVPDASGMPARRIERSVSAGS